MNAVGVGHKGDDCSAGIHGTRFAYYFATTLANFVGRFIDVIHFQGDMTKSITRFIMVSIPVQYW